MIVDLKKRDVILLILLFIMMSLLSILVYKAFFTKEKDTNYIKKNKYNVFETNYITNDKQADSYLSNYYALLYWDIDNAYEKLDSINKFSDKKSFKEYINGLDLSSSVVKKFKYYEIGDYDYYDVYDLNGNQFIFKVKGVMKYTVIINK